MGHGKTAFSNFLAIGLGHQVGFWLFLKNWHCCFQCSPAIFHASGTLEIKRNSRGPENASSSSPFPNSLSVLTSGKRILLWQQFYKRSCRGKVTVAIGLTQVFVSRDVVVGTGRWGRVRSRVYKRSPSMAALSPGQIGSPEGCAEIQIAGGPPTPSF